MKIYKPIELIYIEKDLWFVLRNDVYNRYFRLMIPQTVTYLNHINSYSIYRGYYDDSYILDFYNKRFKNVS